MRMSRPKVMASKPDNWLKRAKAVLKGRLNSKRRAGESVATATEGASQGAFLVNAVQHPEQTGIRNETSLEQHDEITSPIKFNTETLVDEHKSNKTTGADDEPSTSRQAHQDEQTAGPSNHIGKTLDEKKQSAMPLPEMPPIILEGHTGPVKHVGVSRDGKLIASVSTDKTLCIWDGVSRKPLRSFTLDCKPVTGLAMSTRDGHVAVAVDRSIRIWDLNRAMASQSNSNSRPQKTHNLFEPVNSVAFSPDGSLLACGAEDHIYAWNLPSHTLHTVAEVKGRRHNVFFSPTDGLGYTSNVGQIIFRDRDHLTLNWQRMDHGEAISCIASSPKNGLVATGSATGRVRVWLPALSSWKPSMTYELSPAAVTSLAFVNDESFLAAASSTGIWLLGLSNTYKRLSWAIGRTSSVASCEVCNCIVSGGDDGEIRIASPLSAEQITASSPKCIHGNLTAVDSPLAMESHSKQTSTQTTPTSPPPRSPLHSPVIDSIHSQAPLSSVSPPQSPTAATQPSATPTSASPPDAASAPASLQPPGSPGPSPTAQTRTEHVALPVGRPAAPKSASASAALNHPGSASHFSTTSIDPFASASADGVYHPAPEADFNPTIISTTKSYSHYFSPRAPYKEPRKCYMCLGYVEHMAGSSEMCRCRG